MWSRVADDGHAQIVANVVNYVDYVRAIVRLDPLITVEIDQFLFSAPK